MPTITEQNTAQLIGMAPRFLVDDLDRAIAYYTEKLGFTLDFRFELFYAGVSRDGQAIHLKHASKIVEDRAYRKQNEHLDAFIPVAGVRALYEELQGRGALIYKPLEERPWAAVDFYVEDSEGYLLCFSEPTA